MRGQLRIGSVSCWVLAWALAVGGPLAYAFWPSDGRWWIALVTAVPLFVLTDWRADRTHSHPDSSGATSDGVLGPPDAGGGGGL